MSGQDNESADKELIKSTLDGADTACQQRRRLLTMLGVGIATVYVAPTLFTVGSAQARDWGTDRRQRGSYNRGGYNRGSYSRGSYSRASGYDGRRRSRIREYSEDPVLILEDVILGPPRR